MIQTSYQQWVMDPANLGVPKCCPLHVNKPSTTCKPFNMIVTFGATKHKQTTKHLFVPKMSGQLSIVDLVQQYLPTWTWHHQSGLLFWAYVYKFKPIFLHNIKLSMITTCLVCQFPHFCIWWIPCGLTNTCQKGRLNYQQWDNGLVQFPMYTNTLTTTWVVISHSKCRTINW